MKFFSLKTYFFLLGIFLLVSCNSKTGPITKTEVVPTGKDKFNQLITLMQGSFSSLAQHEADPENFYHVHLHIYQIWEGEEDAIWLYVEQAIDKMQEDPYRQRVYKLSQLGFNSFLSETYSIPNDDRFIWSWKELAKGNDQPLFIDLDPLDLTLRKGCGVYLSQDEAGVFSGRTRNRSCTSTREDTEYVNSEVSIGTSFIKSLDQGFDAQDEKVWGADSAYQFDRYLPDLND